MSGDVLLALAQWAGQTVAAAAVTDAWETVRGRFARLLGRGDARKAEVAERWLTQTRDQLVWSRRRLALTWNGCRMRRRSGGLAGSRTC